ncbi:MAG: tRNA (adenosine(37)-N6)-threonylcarbamoyltransferase complex dimerization subunit type 1 TsaB [Bacteroidetes bacterium]|nr:tRNA (adenosine(37)-N6)-threonylcarbamoyltransferase complex dimerization subunit type 1 TsaB [Bacteroidota bacterium]
MSLILSIDTATQQGTVALGADGRLLAAKTNEEQKDHAAWIHVAIRALLEETGHTLQQLDAVAVVAGPGSYTGLRVGMATAKGIGYAMEKPLIALNTLYIMAFAAREKNLLQKSAGTDAENILFCPMIDARRMEVFTALYDNNLKEIVSPSALVLEPGVFDKWQADKKIIFFGNGSDKCKSLGEHKGEIWGDFFYYPEHVTLLAQSGFGERNFADIAYVEPAYLKDFYIQNKNTIVG